MKTFFRQFCAPLVAVAWGAAFALAADPPPLPRDLEAAPSVFGGPAGPVDHLPSNAPLEVPGLPPLPPPPRGESCHFAEAVRDEPACGPRGGFFADVEYLYLKPYRRGLDFGIVSPNRNGDPEGSIQSDPWHSRSAFRVGAGYRLPEDGWEVGFFYTYLHDNEGGVLNRPANGLLFATQTHPGTVEFANSAAADATLSYNIYDLEVGRRMDISQRFAVRPFGGLRFADIGQNFSVLYNGADANRDIVGSRVNFNGGGLRAGGQADWKVLDHVSVYGRGAGSLMVGDFDVTQTEFNNNGTTPLTNVRESFRKITPVLELGVGVSYHTDHFRVSLGYEATNWFNLVDTPSFVNDVHQGKYQRNISDLGVDGLAVKAEVTY
jgi:hypothetical protein